MRAWLGCLALVACGSSAEAPDGADVSGCGDPPGFVCDGTRGHEQCVHGCYECHEGRWMQLVDYCAGDAGLDRVDAVDGAPDVI